MGTPKSSGERSRYRLQTQDSSKKGRLLRLIQGDGEIFHKGEPVLVEGRSATVICPRFTTHVFRGMVSVDFGAGELGLFDEEQVYKADDTGRTP